MKTFNKTQPRKSTKVPFKILDENEIIVTIYRDVTGAERLPFIIHRKVRDFDTGGYVRGMWQITHALTGYSMGIYGSYLFCRAVANDLMGQPILYLPCQKMMTKHEDFHTITRMIEEVSAKHQHLNPVPSLPSP
tara:strand:- start:359 stop:760 length:402 start_codon:yes stop_codon:yes gene_type:complete